MEGSTSERGKKINEYRPVRQSVPKVKMGASDVLGVVHERLEKVATKSEEMADRAVSYTHLTLPTILLV